MCVSLVGAVPRGGILSCRSFYLQCKQSFVSVWTTIGGDPVREDVGRAAAGRSNADQGAQREQKGRGQTPSAQPACLAFSLPWSFMVVCGAGGCGWCWRRSLSVCTPCKTADCGLRAASNENETKRSSVCFLFQRDGGNEETQLSKGSGLRWRTKRGQKRMKLSHRRQHDGTAGASVQFSMVGEDGQNRLCRLEARLLL